MKTPYFLAALAATVSVFAVSCDTVPDAAARTDAVEGEIFHGRPKTLRTATYPAYSNAGEWFKDTAARDVRRSVSTYNIDGCLTEEAYIQGDTLPTVILTYEYTVGSPRKVAAVRMADTVETARVVYRYDKDGRLIGTATTGAGGAVTGREDYTLNGRGFRKEARYSNGYGVLRRREVNEYNRAGELTGQDVYFYGGKDNNRHTVIRYTYQGNGLKASATVQDEQASPKETRISFLYEYDAQGNWIRRVAYNETLKTAEMTERKIEYYQ